MNPGRILSTLFVFLLALGGSGPARGEDASADEAPPPAEAPPPGDGVLRYKGIEIKPDIKVYADYQVDLSDEDHANAFHLTRAYLGLKLKVTKWLSGRVTYDVTTVKNVAASGDYSVVDDGISISDHKLHGSVVGRIKYAYVDAKVLPADFAIRAGVLHTPWIDWAQTLEDTRFLRRTMWEHEYKYPSADFGIAFIGNAGNVLTYHLGIYNGEGYSGLEEIGFKDVIGRLSVRPAPNHKVLQGLQLSAYAHGEFPLKDGVETDRRLGGAVTWRIADKIVDPDCKKVEGDKAAIWVQIKTGEYGDPAIELSRNLGMSFGARIELPARLYIIARADRFDPDLDVDDDEFWRPLGAFGVRLHKTFHVALAYQGKLPVAGGDPDHLIGIHTEFRL